jgi:hypothetical protein
MASRQSSEFLNAVCAKREGHHPPLKNPTTITDIVIITNSINEAKMYCDRGSNPGPSANDHDLIM